MINDPEHCRKRHWARSVRFRGQDSIEFLLSIRFDGNLEEYSEIRIDDRFSSVSYLDVTQLDSVRTNSMERFRRATEPEYKKENCPLNNERPAYFLKQLEKLCSLMRPQAKVRIDKVELIRDREPLHDACNTMLHIQHNFRMDD